MLTSGELDRAIFLGNIIYCNWIQGGPLHCVLDDGNLEDQFLNDEGFDSWYADAISGRGYFDNERHPEEEIRWTLEAARQLLPLLQRAYMSQREQIRRESSSFLYLGQPYWKTATTKENAAFREIREERKAAIWSIWREEMLMDGNGSSNG